MKTFTPSHDHIDLVINHPDVRPYVQQGVGRIYSDGYISALDLVVGYEGGVALFRYFGNGCYDGHIFTLPGSRGVEALRFGRLALARLATRKDAVWLRTGVPVVLPAARMYCRRLGLKSEGRDLFNEYFSTEIARWAE